MNQPSDVMGPMGVVLVVQRRQHATVPKTDAHGLDLPARLSMRTFLAQAARTDIEASTRQMGLGELLAGKAIDPVRSQDERRGVERSLGQSAGLGQCGQRILIAVDDRLEGSADVTGRVPCCTADAERSS
jgi:hypothetical protein